MTSTAKSQDSPPRPTRSLRYQIISRGTVRSLLVTLVLCVVSYYHILGILEEGLIEQLSKYMAERGIRDSAEFIQTELHHDAFEKELLQQMAAVPLERGVELFDDYFRPWGDGTWRTREEWYQGHLYRDGLYHGGFTGFIGRDIDVTPELRRKVAVMTGLLEWYATVWTSTGQYINYYVSSPENVLIGEFIGVPYMHEVPADTDFPGEIFVAPANERNNPAREIVWTHFYFDETAKVWLVSSLKPIYSDDRLIATTGQDILLDDFMQRVIQDRLQGSRNIAFDARGTLIAYEPWLDRIQAAGGALNITDTDDTLREVFAAVTAETGKSGVEETGQAYLAFTRIEGPDWYLVNIYPKSLLQTQGASAAAIILGIAILGLLTEFVVLWSLISAHVLKPLGSVVGKIRRVGRGQSGDSRDSSPSNQCEEFEELSHAFDRMAEQLDASLQTQLEINQNLDRLVRERTTELENANAKLQTMAVTDEMSGLFNRRQFQTLIPEEISRAVRMEHSNLWMILWVVDIDFFKQFNDTYGHQAGDDAIRAVAACLRRQNQRAGEPCFRIGGEEFAVFSTVDRLDRDKLKASVENLLIAVRELVLTAEAGSVDMHLTLSAGVVCMQAEVGINLDNLYMAADRALYAAKKNGRDQGRIIIGSIGQPVEDFEEISV